MFGGLKKAFKKVGGIAMAPLGLAGIGLGGLGGLLGSKGSGGGSGYNQTGADARLTGIKQNYANQLQRAPEIAPQLGNLWQQRMASYGGGDPSSYKLPTFARKLQTPTEAQAYQPQGMLGGSPRANSLAALGMAQMALAKKK